MSSSPLMVGLTVLISVLALTGSLVLMDPWLDLSNSPALIAISVIPAILVYLFFLALTRRGLLALLLSLLPLALVFYVNAIKMGELGEPLMAADFSLIPQTLAEIGLFVRYSHTAILVALVFLILTILFLLFRFEPKLFGLKTALVLLGISIGSGLMLNTQVVSDAYARHGVFDSAWTPADAIYQTGLISSLIAHGSISLNARPSLNPTALSLVLAQFASETATRSALHAPRERPDLLIIQSESFFDLSILKGIEECDIVSVWCELSQRHLSGSISVPTYGGNSTRTEFEVLTGVAYSAIQPGVYPYTSVVIRPTQSITWALANHGYHRTVVHPHTKKFWNRDRAMPLLGFEHFIAEDQFKQAVRRGLWISDAALTDRMIKISERSENDQPAFVYGISMENHGPWGKARRMLTPEQLGSISVPEKLDDEASLLLRQFAFHLQGAVSELVRLETWMNQRQRPTMILFFGDHLPSLPPVYEQLGFDHDQPVQLHPTPYLLMSNIELQPDWMPTRASQLGLWLIELAGVEMNTAQTTLLNIHRQAADQPQPSQEQLLALYAELLHQTPVLSTAEGSQ